MFPRAMYLLTLVSIDFFTVPTIRFQVLYVFLVWPMTAAAFCPLFLPEAVARADEVLTMGGRHVGSMGTLAATFVDWGKRPEAEEIYAELTARARLGY